MKKMVLNIQGMSCMHCVKTVKQIFSEIDGVVNVEINLEQNIVEVEINKEAVSKNQFINALTDTNYSVIL